MPVVLGYFDKLGNPRVKLTVGGFDNREFEAIVDTGFTGFVSTPWVTAFPLGLALCGTMQLTYGDGTTQTNLTAVGIVTMKEQRQSGIIVLQPQASEVLVGMDLLRKFKYSLLVDNEGITLITEDLIQAIHAEARVGEQPPEAKPAAQP